MNKINSVLSFANDTDNWQSDMKTTAYAKSFKNMLGDAKKMYRTWLDTEDYITKNKFISWSNLNSLAGAIVTYAGTKWKFDDYADLEASEIVEKFLDKNKGMWFENYVNEYIWWEISLAEASNKMGMTQVHYSSPDVFSEDIDDYDFDPTLLSDYDPEDWADTLWEPNISDDSWISNPLLNWWVWLWTVGLGGVWLNAAWRLSQWWWRQLYNLPIDPTIEEAYKKQSLWADVKDAEVEVKEAKSNLKDAKNSGEWVEEATKKLEQAEKNLDNLKWKRIRTVADTARDYNIWGWLLEWWTAESRWIQAQHELRQLWSNKIEKALEESSSTINLQELIDDLSNDIERLAKNDPDKLAAYKNALEDLKNSYKWTEYATYSMKDAQTLKSWLQWRTPQKFWKWQEITNELQELKWILSSKIKDEIHSILGREAWEDVAKLYLDYSNLKKYASSMAKQSTNAWMKQWFGWFWSNIYHNLTDWAFAKWWLLLDKVWWVFKKYTNPKTYVNKINTLIKTIKSNPKLLLKSLKAIAPWDLIMPDFSYSAMKERSEKLHESDERNEWVNRNWGTDISEDEWKALLGEEWYSMIDENWGNSLEEKWWTQEWIITLLDSIE